MSTIWKGLSLVCRAASQLTSKCTRLQAPQVPNKLPVPPHISLLAARWSSSYKHPTDIQTPSPYRKPLVHKPTYKLYDGGVLPRPEGKYEDVPLPMPTVSRQKRDQWTQKKALFGQNDYIDILGDGSVHPADYMRGPRWLTKFKGNELQRITRRLQFQGSFLREMHPMKYHNLRKRQFFLYKRFNRRKRSFHWGSARTSARSRIQRIID